MSRRRKFYLVKTQCRRCGTSLFTSNRSITGADAAKRQYDRLCEDCTTPEEADAMIDAQAAALLGRSLR